MPSGGWPTLAPLRLRRPTRRGFRRGELGDRRDVSHTLGEELGNAGGPSWGGTPEGLGRTVALSTESCLIQIQMRNCFSTTNRQTHS